MRLLSIKVAESNLAIINSENLRKYSAKNIPFAIFKTVGYSKEVISDFLPNSK